MWKNILLTVVFTLWLLLLGYSLSCFVAYLVGCPPFVAPLVFAFLSLIALNICWGMHKKKGLSPNIFVILLSLFISSVANAVNLGVKFGEDHSYRGSVIRDSYYGHANLYNKWGYKIINVSGLIRYDDIAVYLETKTHVYKFNYDGDMIADADFDEDAQYGYASVLQHPFTKKYYIRGERVYDEAYVDYDYLGDTDYADFIQCKEQGGLWKLVEVGKKYGSIDVNYDDYQEIKAIGYHPIHCFVVKDGEYYKILDSSGREVYKTKTGIRSPFHYEKSTKRFYYDDNNGKRWYHQL